MKKLLAGLLAALMIFSAAPMTGLAAQAEEQEAGAVAAQVDAGTSTPQDDFTASIADFLLQIVSNLSAQRERQDLQEALDAPAMPDNAKEAAAPTKAVGNAVALAAEGTYEDFKYQVLEDGTAEITDYTGSAAELVIPSEIDGYPVTSIGDYAFDNCTFLTNITIPNSITGIGDGAFRSCTTLANITIPNSVTSIGDYAFDNCTALTNITIPSSVRRIEWSAFSRCTSLTDITVETENEQYADLEGVLYNKEQTELIRYPEGKQATSYSIPNGVTSIGDGMFYGCTALTNITIPNSVTSVAHYMFSGCTSLKNITIPSSVTSIGGSAFSGCTSLASITIPNSVTSIGNFAFSDCTSLTNVTIPSSVTRIEWGAFSGCTSMTNIAIPSSVASIESSTFSGCASLTNITIPNSVTNIGDGAFRNCTSLTNITIPSSVTSIGMSAFTDCTSLTNITIPNSVTSVEHYTFSGCTSLTNITIPNSVTRICLRAFFGCTSLISITIPNSVTIIDTNVFLGCDSLSQIHYDGSQAQWYKITIREGNDALMNATIYCKGGLEEQAFPLSIMDDLNARSFLGFIFNDSSFNNADLSGNSFYQLLTGVYKDNLDKQLEVGTAFLITVSAQLAARIQTAAETKNYLQQSLMTYLQKQLAGIDALPEQEYNKLLNSCLDNLKEGILDGLLYLTSQTTGMIITQEMIDNINLVSSAYNQVMGLPQKIEKFVETTVAAVQVAFLPLADELNGRYQYFDLYLRNRKTFEPEEEAFRFLMDYNAWALKQENGAGALINCLPNVSAWTENIPTIEYWAEYVYQLQLALTQQEQSSQFGNKNYKFVSVQCPVDVFVYNASGQAVGSIENDKVQVCTDDQIYLTLLGESKVICIPSDAGYRIQIVAREEGAFSYSCKSIDQNGQETERVNFYDVPMSAGTKFLVQPDADHAVLQVVDEDGEIQETLDSSEVISGQAEKCNVLLHISGKGSAFGNALYTKGDYVSLLAAPEEGYTFEGWYVNGKKVSDKASGYGFTAIEDVTMEARFVPEEVAVTGLTLSETLLSLNVGDSAMLQAAVSPADATDQRIQWISGDETVASVGQDGKVTAHQAGTAIITATTEDGGYTASCTVTVTAPTLTLTLDGQAVEGDVAYVKLPSVLMMYKNHSATLGFAFDQEVEVASVNWSYASWSVDSPEANIESPTSAETVVRPNGKGIGARSTWVTLTVTDVDGNTYQKTVKVRFYKWDWQRK